MIRAYDYIFEDDQYVVGYYPNREGGTIYAGVDRLHGGWMCRTNGNPFSLGDCESAGDYDTVRQVDAVIKAGVDRPSTDDDRKYIMDILDIWGI